MAANYENISSVSSRIAVCSLCRKVLSPDDEMTRDPATGSVCGDCKFLLLEDFASHPFTPRRLRGRLRHNSSESVDTTFSQQPPHMDNTSGQNESVEDDQLIDSDTPAWSLQYTSPHTRRRQVLSDTDSDGFDNWSSMYADNDSEASFRQYRVSHGETDSFTFSAYGGDSEISMDRQSFVGTGMFNLLDEGDEFNSDSDIDPMHAGLSQWNSDDTEDDEEEENEDEEEEEVDQAVTAARLRILLTSSPSESRSHNNWEQMFNHTESDGVLSRIIRDTWQALEEVDLPQRENFGGYLDTRQFEDLLDHLAENDSSRRGAPPAAVSFVNNLPCVIISNEHEKHGELVCAICKDALAAGTEVNQLPCSHLYHSYCILPWLKARNSCPLCRYELPTDDKDYEEGKQNIEGRNMIHERQQLDVMDDSLSDVYDGAELSEGDSTSTTQGGTNSGRGRWLFLAAAPIVSIVGMVLVLWLGSNSRIEGSRQNQHAVHVYASPNQRVSRNRRWWCPF